MKPPKLKVKVGFLGAWGHEVLIAGQRLRAALTPAAIYIVGIITALRKRWRLSNPVILGIGFVFGLGLSLFLLRLFLFKSGVPVYSDLTWPYSSHVFPMHYLWDEFRQTSVAPNHMMAYYIFYQFSAETALRLIYLFVFTMAGMSMFFVAYKLTAPRHPTAKVPLITASIVTVFYLVNPVICRFWLLWYFIWLYAFMPLFFYVCYSTFTKIHMMDRWALLRRAIIIALILFIITVGSYIQLVLPFLVLAFLAALSRPYMQYVKRSFLLVGLTLVLSFVFSAIWAVPQVLGGYDPKDYWGWDRDVFYKLSKGRNMSMFLCFNLEAFPIALKSQTFHLPEQWKPYWEPSLLVVPSLAFIAVLFRRSKLIIWLAIFAVLFIFLGKGTSPPWGGLYEWFACDAPGSGFYGGALKRPQRWLMPLMLCYCALYGFTISYVLGWIRDCGKKGGQNRESVARYLKYPIRRIWEASGINKAAAPMCHRLGRIISTLCRAICRRGLFIVAVIVFALAPLFPGFPMLTGDVNHLLDPKRVGTGFLEMGDWMLEDPSQFKVMYYRDPYPYGSAKPEMPKGPLLEPSHQPLGYTLISWSLRVEPMLSSVKYGEMLSPMNVKYLIFRRTVPEDRAKILFSYLEAQKDLTLVKEFSPNLFIYENQTDHPQIAASARSVAVSGGMANMFSLTAVDAYNLVDSPIFLLDESVTSSDYLPGAELLVSNVNSLDVYLSLLDEKYMVAPAEAFDCFPRRTGWLKATAAGLPGLVWRYFAWSPEWWERWQLDYRKGLVRSTQLASLEIPFKVDESGDYLILMRCFCNENGGSIKLELDGEDLGDVPTKSHLNAVLWKEIGSFNLQAGGHTLSIEQHGRGNNAINLFAVIPPEMLESYEAQASDLISDKRIVSIVEAETSLNHSGAERSTRHGGYASQGWVLSMPPGTQAWQDIDILRDGEYKLAVRLNGSARVSIDEQVFTVSSGELDFSSAGPIYLNKGVHNLLVSTTDAQSCDLDVIWLYSVEEASETLEDILSTGRDKVEALEYEKIDPTKYRTTVNATQPFMLSFAEIYNRMWVAKVNGKEYPSIPLELMVNGFWIEETGQLEITIEYKPQQWMYYGLAISGGSIIMALAFLIWEWLRRRRRSARS